MGRELSDVFKAKTRVGKRKVLDKFDISKEDKNKFLNGIEDAGSGGSGSGEASSIEYLDLRNYSGTAFGVAVNAKSLLFKFNSNRFNGDSESAPVYQIYVVGDVLEAGNAYIQALLMGSDFVGIDFNLKTNGRGELKTTAQQIIEDQGITQEQLDAIPRITKEQFYSLK